VLWYHWPHDDYTGKEDYEPVVLFYSQEGLVAIGIRPHERYKLTKRWLTEGPRPIVVFTTAWHGPIVFQGRAADAITPAFMHPSVSIRMADYDLKPGRPPIWFEKDGTDVSIHDFAAHASSRLSP